MKYERGYQYRDIPELPGDSRWRLPLMAPDPERVNGPEKGALVLYHDRYGLGPEKVEGSYIVVKVVERYYHWSPEVVIFEDGKPLGRGYIHYNWSVIQFRPDGETMVVNDSDLKTDLDVSDQTIGKVVAI